MTSLAGLEPVWLREARTFIGTKEIKGDLDNPVIMGFAKELGGWYASFYKHDEIAWCGLFVGAMMHRSNLWIPPNALGALNWATWGKALEQGSIGAVLVFKRPGGGHVGFYVGEDTDCYHVLGGNQGDSVSIARVEKARCVGVRWPSELVIPAVGPTIIADSAAPVSENEA